MSPTVMHLKINLTRVIWYLQLSNNFEPWMFKMNFNIKINNRKLKGSYNNCTDRQWSLSQLLYGPNVIVQGCLTYVYNVIWILSSAVMHLKINLMRTIWYLKRINAKVNNRNLEGSYNKITPSIAQSDNYSLLYFITNSILTSSCRNNV